MQRMGKRLRGAYALPLYRVGPAILLAAAFLLGGVLGCLFARGMPAGEVAGLSDYLEGYLRLAETGEVPRALPQLLWSRLWPLGAALVLGCSGLGLAGLPLLCGGCGFFYAFSSACFCLLFGWRGLFPAFALFGLPALLWVPALLLTGCAGVRQSAGLLRLCRGGPVPEPVPLRPRLALSVPLLLGSALVEYSAAPPLLRASAAVLLA